MSFGNTLITAAGQHGPLCLGIDPHAGRIPALFGGDTPEGMESWGRALVELATGQVAVVKPQAGLFERHGPAGMAALQAITRAAREAGLLVIMDAKRGDIGSTAEGYAATFLGEDAPYPAHCLTVNPYMGLDTIEPFMRRAEATGTGIAVLTRTSNPGAADFEALPIHGDPLYLHVARALRPLADRLTDPATGSDAWSSLMIVAGATGPDEARALRAALPRVPFLVPGYGAQGASAADAMAGFIPGPDGLTGGVVNASRAITFPPGSEDADTRDRWDAAIHTALTRAKADLGAAAAAS